MPPPKPTTVQTDKTSIKFPSPMVDQRAILNEIKSSNNNAAYLACCSDDSVPNGLTFGRASKSSYSDAAVVAAADATIHPVVIRSCPCHCCRCPYS